MDPIIKFPSSLVAELLAAKSFGEDFVLEKVCTDTRNLKHGDVFIALRGNRFDGNRFIATAKQKGAVGAIVEEMDEQVDLPQLQVQDTREALAQLAGQWRHAYSGVTIALTGSNGKTTTKEMLALMLADAGKTLATQGNLNNDIGVPLTLLRLRRDVCFAVVEIGANHPGEIERMVNVVAPDIALVTNVGEAHLEGFHSLDGVAQAKGEIYSGGHRVAVINLDSSYAPYLIRLNHNKNIITFSMQGAENATFAAEMHQTRDQGAHARVHTPQGDFDLNLQVSGAHNISNALAALSAVYACGLPLQAAIERLAQYQGHSSRQEVVFCGNNRLIDDSYNANPASFRAGIDVLATAQGTRVLVCGDMNELGRNAVELHLGIGAYAASAGIDRLFACGRMAEHYQKGFGQNAIIFNDKESLLAALRPFLTTQPSWSCLVKGSRSSHMEVVVEALKQSFAAEKQEA